MPLRKPARTGRRQRNKPFIGGSPGGLGAALHCRFTIFAELRRSGLGARCDRKSTACSVRPKTITRRVPHPDWRRFLRWPFTLCLRMAGTHATCPASKPRRRVNKMPQAFPGSTLLIAFCDVVLDQAARPREQVARQLCYDPRECQRRGNPEMLGLAHSRYWAAMQRKKARYEVTVIDHVERAAET